MFRRTIASAAFLVTVVFGATTGRAGAIAIDTASCTEEEIAELTLMFGHAKKVIETIVPADVVPPSWGMWDNWTSPYVDNNGAGSAYMVWFGEPDADGELVAEVKDTLLKIAVILREPIEEFDVDPHSPPPEDVWVYFKCGYNPEGSDDYEFQFGNGQALTAWTSMETIYFPRFSDPEVPLFAYNGTSASGIGAFSSKVGVMIHELSHRVGTRQDQGHPAVCESEKRDEDIADIYPVCYWAQECLDLAAEYPDKAVDNAENYEKFTVYVYMHAMAAQFVASTHPLMH